MSHIISKIKDDFTVVSKLSYFVEHPIFKHVFSYVLDVVLADLSFAKQAILDLKLQPVLLDSLTNNWSKLNWLNFRTCSSTKFVKDNKI